MNCISRKNFYLIIESIRSLSPFPKNVGKLPNLVKYCVCFLSCLFVLVFWVLLCASLFVTWDFSLVVTKARVTSGIIASQVLRRIVCRFQEHGGCLTEIMCRSRSSL